MKKLLLALLSLFLLFSLSCAPVKTSKTILGVMDTDVTLVLYGEVKDGVLDGCESNLRAYEKVFSRTDAGAELYRLNHRLENDASLSAALAEALAVALSLSEESGGLFDVTAGVLSDLYDIGGDAPLPPDEDDVAAALAYVGYSGVLLNGTAFSAPVGTVLDLGAIAKGIVAEKTVAYLQSCGVTGGVLSLGGNIAVFGEKPGGAPFTVGIRHPEENDVFGVLSLTGEQYVSTSGAYERYRVGADGKTYHHIFDPRTGAPAASDLLSVTVIANDGAYADAFSTALFVMGWDAAIAWDATSDASVVLMKNDGSIYVSDNLTFELA